MMNRTIHSKVIKIGNSHGIRIPRTILEQIGLTDEIEMTVDGNTLIIHSTHHPRQGWSTHFSSMAENGDDRLLDEPLPTHWDVKEWAW
jgi:antitoxin MazE